MSKLNRFIIATLAVLFMAGSTAYAGGFSVGVMGNLATFDTTGEEIERTLPANVTKEDPNAGSAGADADFPSFFVEYTMGEGAGTQMTIGLSMVPGSAEIGSKSRTDTVSDSNEDSSDTGTYTGKADVEDLITLYVQPTYMFSDTFGFYGTAGVSQVKVLTLENIAIGADSSTYNDATIYGAHFGVGIRANHASGMFMKLEGTKTHFEELKLRSNTGNQNEIHAKPVMDNVVLAIGYNF